MRTTQRRASERKPRSRFLMFLLASLTSMTAVASPSIREDLRAQGRRLLDSQLVIQFDESVTRNEREAFLEERGLRLLFEDRGGAMVACAVPERGSARRTAVELGREPIVRGVAPAVKDQSGVIHYYAPNELLIQMSERIAGTEKERVLGGIDARNVTPGAGLGPYSAVFRSEREWNKAYRALVRNDSVMYVSPVPLGTIAFAAAGPTGTSSEPLPWQVVRPTTWDLQTDDDLGSANLAFLDFKQRYPGEWIVRWDRRTGAPSLLYGPGIPLSTAALDEDVAGVKEIVRELALGFLDDNESLFQLGSYALDGEPLLAGNTWILNLRLSYGGVPLEEHSRVGFRIKQDGGLAALKLESIPSRIEPLVASVPATEAIGVAARTIDDHSTPLFITPPTLAILDDESGIGRLVWRFALHRADISSPLAIEYFVHAREAARLIEARNLISYQRVPIRTHIPSRPTSGVQFAKWNPFKGCEGSRTYCGHVQGKVLLEGPFSDKSYREFSDIIVDIIEKGSGSTYTDAAGNFCISSTSSHYLCWVRMRSEMRGRWCSVNNAAGSNLREFEYHGPNLTFNFDQNSLPSEHKTAQSTAYYWTTKAHNWSSAIMNGNNGVERQIQVNVNVFDPIGCNAFYSRLTGSLTFFGETSNCTNMAYSDVIAHEYGHAIDDGHGGILSSTYSEGFGDAIAMALTDQSLVGRGNPIVTRDGSQVQLWPASGCGTDIHCVGQTYAGFTFELTTLLKNHLGIAFGRATADRLILWPAMANPNSIPDAVFETFVADDNDAILTNGTPNICDIVAAAKSRNLPLPAPFGEVVHFKFDNSSNPGVDSSGRGHHADTVAAEFVPDGGVLGSGAVSFDPTNDIVEFAVPQTDDLNLLGAMTGVAWIYPTGDHNSDNDPPNCIEGTIFMKGGNYWFQVNQTNDGLMFQNDGSGAEGTYVRLTGGSAVIPLNAWTQVAFVRPNATSVRLYKNGVYIGGGSTLQTPQYNWSPFTVGNAEREYTCEFNGRIDEVQVFSRALCDDEIYRLYCDQAACFR